MLSGDVRSAARALARAAGAAAFALSDEFGAWRVVARSGAWHVDINPLRGARIEDDLALRDFTINALAEPLGGGDVLDPLGGLEDLEAGRLRLAAPGALETDPLRALRLVRFVCELDLTPDEQAAGAARAVAARVADVAPERVYAELQKILASERAVGGMRLLGDLGLTAAILPELDALGGVQQSRYHHLDVGGHTLEALSELIALQRAPASVFGAQAAVALEALLAEPLADGMSRGVAMRFAALMHDIAKPLTRTVAPDGRVAFPGHDARGAELRARSSAACAPRPACRATSRI